MRTEVLENNKLNNSNSSLQFIGDKPCYKNFDYVPVKVNKGFLFFLLDKFILILKFKILLLKNFF